MNEEAFRQKVRKVARAFGWTLNYHTYNSQRSDPGWPDEVFFNPNRGRIIFVEFKSEKGRIRPAQKEWIDALKSAGLEADVWRPSDMDRILLVLGKEQLSLRAGVAEAETPAVESDPGWMFGSEVGAG